MVQRVDVTGEGKSMPYLTIATTAETILSEGIASQVELDEALAGLAALAADENHRGRVTTADPGLGSPAR